MATYTIDSQASRLVVTARSSVHDTDTSFVGITGQVNADPAAMADTRAEVAVDMKTADAGDWLKNRKLRKDMDFEKYPHASFRLTGISDIVEKGARVAATLSGRFGYDVPVLGEIPLQPTMREGGDSGRPIVDEEPDSPAAAELTKVATTLSGRGRGLAGMQLGLTPAGRL